MAAELLDGNPMTLSKTDASRFASAADRPGSTGVMSRANLSKRGCQILEALDEIFELLESADSDRQGD